MPWSVYSITLFISRKWGGGRLNIYAGQPVGGKTNIKAMVLVLLFLFEEFCLLIGLSCKIYNPRDLWGNNYSLFDFHELNVLLDKKVLKMQYATHTHRIHPRDNGFYVCVCVCGAYRTSFD